jgi:hypothetical protein
MGCSKRNVESQIKFWRSEASEYGLWFVFTLKSKLDFHATKSSPLKALGQMNQNLVESILGRSSIKWVWKGSKRDTWMAFFRKHDKEKILFRNQPIRNKNGLWWPCLLTDQDEMSKLYRGPSIDASYQVSVHLAKWFQRRIFIAHFVPIG